MAISARKGSKKNAYGVTELRYKSIKESFLPKNNDCTRQKAGAVYRF
jgi:hypothetical protein